jgi:hypothetical protein
MNGYLKNFKEQIDTLNNVYYELIKPILVMDTSLITKPKKG